MKQPELYERFKALHERPNGFVMPNAWDGVSAALLKEAGFEALGTSSAAIASALGRLDGRHTITREEHIENAKLLNRLSGLPINGDFEDGYGDKPEGRRGHRRGFDRGRPRRHRHRRYLRRSR